MVERRFAVLSKPALGFVLSALALHGCARAEPPASGTEAPAQAAPARPPAADTAAKDAAPSARKVIRRAELAIEVASATAAQSQVTRIAESHGGYVASAARDVAAPEDEHARARVRMTLRVPATKLTAVLESIKRLGTGSESERIESEDATDEYVDVEARIANQRRLEEQFLAILKNATTVSDALNVQRELSAVRTEIDRLEGRRRVIEKEAALSTVELSISTLRPLVSASVSDFERSAIRAYSDAIAVAAGLVTFAIRAFGITAPLVVLLGIPAWLLVRVVRRLTRRRLPAAV